MATTRASKNTVLRIGTAGWTVPRDFAEPFPVEGCHLSRYAEILTGVEINSSFHRPHQAKTYRRWSEETPDHFSFSVKMTKEFTHTQRLEVTKKDLAEWLGPVRELDKKLGALLVQLPPSLEFNAKIANTFFKHLRHHYQGLVALEPRHVTWTAQEALVLLDNFDVTKVEADPERCPIPKAKISHAKPRYVRLHGSPVIYKSRYEKDVIEQWATELKKQKSKQASWVIFDNTTFGFATANALELKDLMSQDVVAAPVSSSSSRKFKRRSAGETKNIAPTVTKQRPAPITAD